MVSRWEGLSPIAKGATLFIATLFIGANIVVAINYFGPIWLTTNQPSQPINFSHKLHAGDNKISCQYCHSDARRSEIAGIPSAQKCMNCHTYVKAEAPEVLKVSDHFDNETQIEWNKVFNLPDHVWFNHKRHIQKGFACQECHGPIETMDVVYRTNEFPMGFCLNCHRKNDAPTDCWDCHT